ncbi:MAG: hypothetical protein ACTFAL_04870 [Candidatus Electronema sp. V4]|uniref:hypothetical protein n=1 Tax=Candidatus Electronema sp. V4 TaxID=3454756 RepID=UPI0040559035
MNMTRRSACWLLLAAALTMNAPQPAAASPVQWQQLMASEDGVSLAVDGSTAVVGAPGEDKMKGAAYVFVRTGTTWTQQARLTAAEATEYSIFGGAVAVSGDTILIGAGSDGNHGAVYVFVRSGDKWQQQARLMAEDSRPDDGFGLSVAVSKDTAVIGAFREDYSKTQLGSAYAGQGSAYVFVRSGSTWKQQAKLMAADSLADSGTFGAEVTADGDTVLVARPALNLAHVFFRSGGNWAEQSKAAGRSAALQGDTALIGSQTGSVDPAKKALPAVAPGSVSVFKRAGGLWTLQTLLTAKDAPADPAFGALVAVDGKTAVIAATDHKDGAKPGSVYFFANKDGNWQEQAKLPAAEGMPVIHSLALSGSTMAAVMGKKSNRAESVAYVATLPASAAQ